MGFRSFLKKKEKSTGRLEIGDDSGFIGLVNNDLYESFVGEDWELEDVLWWNEDDKP